MIFQEAGQVIDIDKLRKERLIKARDYIFAHGDDVNRAWFRCLFEGNSADEFLKVPAKYQHENGGFGGTYYSNPRHCEVQLISARIELCGENAPATKLYSYG